MKTGTKHTYEKAARILAWDALSKEQQQAFKDKAQETYKKKFRQRLIKGVSTETLLAELQSRGTK